MNSPPLGIMADRRVARVKDVIVGKFGRAALQMNVIEQAIHSMDAKPRSANSGAKPRSNYEPLDWPPFPQTEKDKKTATRLARPFEKLEKRLADFKQSRDDWGVLMRATYGYGDDRDKFTEWLAELRSWREQLEGFAGKGSEMTGLFAPEMPETKHQPSKELKHRAALAASWIMIGHGRPLRVTKIDRARRGSGSVFVKIAKILANDEDCTYECRVLRDQLKREASKAKSTAQRKARNRVAN